MSAAGVDPVDVGAVRRVVSGVGPDGRSTVVEDAASPYLVQSIPGYVQHTEIWTTPSPPPGEGPLADGALGAPTESYDPVDPRGTICRVVCFQPDPPGTDPDDLMHSTTTVDYIVVLAGEITCIYEDGSDVTLGPGEILVQRGVPHSWSNRGEVPCTYVSVQVGAPDHAPAG